jgi:hypothetical protein
MMLDRERSPGEPDPDHVEPLDSQVRVREGSAWWLAGASRRGTSHEVTGADREDALALHLGETGLGPRWFCVTVADGVGTARFARVASGLVTRTLLEIVRQECARSPPAAGDLRRILSVAAWRALHALNAEAAARNVPLKELGTTLLAVLGVEESPETLSLGVFQAGNGLIARADKDGGLEPLLDPGDQSEDGSIYDLPSVGVRETWDDRRFKLLMLDPAPWAVVLMTDGLADDLLPLREKAPVLCTELRQLSPGTGAGESLLELLSYKKRGSADDRTLGCAFRMTEGGSGAKSEESAKEAP